MNRIQRPTHNGYAVYEFWKITPEQLADAKLNPARVPGEGIGTASGTLHRPHRSMTAAVIEMLARRLSPAFGPGTQMKIVDHDGEMRRWGRYDFVIEQTEDNKERVEKMYNRGKKTS